MNKIKCVIEARMGSKRLPGKTMKILFKKFRLIDYVISNALSSKYLNKKNLYLLTSKKKNNLNLIKYIKNRYKIQIIKGSEKNVFSRYLVLKNEKNFSFLRLTADNPFVDPKIINKFIEKFFFLKADYLTSRAMTHSNNWNVKSDFPKGISLEMFNSKKFFEKQNSFNLKNCDSPTWFFFNRKIKGKIKKFKSFNFYKKLNKNDTFTIDTKIDYLRIKKIINKYKFLPGKNNLEFFVKNSIKKNYI